MPVVWSERVTGMISDVERLACVSSRKCESFWWSLSGWVVRRRHRYHFHGDPRGICWVVMSGDRALYRFRQKEDHKCPISPIPWLGYSPISHLSSHYHLPRWDDEIGERASVCHVFRPYEERSERDSKRVTKDMASASLTGIIIMFTSRRHDEGDN